MVNIKTLPSRLHFKAVLQALLVTFLWSTSYVLIKIGLQASLPPLTFAGLRYCLAFLCLLPPVLGSPSQRQMVRGMPARSWAQLAALGLVYYTLTQGTQFIGLAYLPAATLTLLYNFTPVIVALMSSLLGQEPPARGQWGGILMTVVGALVYFFPLNLPVEQTFGLAVGLLGLLTNAGSSVLGRQVNHKSVLTPTVVTTVSMGFGGLLLLLVGVITQGFGALNLQQGLIIAWLAVVNTAAAFTLWNHTLRTLTAVESSIINGMMLPQIAILAWLFLGEPLSPRQIAGLVLVGSGTMVVQLWRVFPFQRKQKPRLTQS